MRKCRACETYKTKVRREMNMKEIPTEEVEEELLEAAHVTCEEMRVFYGAESGFIHLPEQCAGCRLLRNRLRKAFELGFEAAVS